MHIILADWCGYELFRTKILGENLIHCGLGSILANMAAYQSGINFEVTVVLNSNLGERRWFVKRILFSDEALPYAQRYFELKKKYHFINKIIFRSNFGRDIGAYNCGYHYLKRIGYKGDVVFLNTSCGGPSENGWLLKYRDQFYSRKDVGLCGISMYSHNVNEPSNPFMPHIQSFFLFTNMDVLRKVFPNNLCGIWIRHNKLKLIKKGEIGISQKILNEGYGICCIAFKDFFYYKNAQWSIIQKRGFRYLKEFRKYVNQI